MPSNLERVRQAICEVFGEYIGFKDVTEDGEILIDWEKVRRVVEADTYTGLENPGGWCPGAEVVIYTENGIPNGAYEPMIFDKWFEVSDKLGDLFVEHYNAAVIAVYRV